MLFFNLILVLARTEQCLTACKSALMKKLHF